MNQQELIYWIDGFISGVESQKYGVLPRELELIREKIDLVMDFERPKKPETPETPITEYYNN